MTDSILNTTKKALNLAADDDAFDPELIMHINSVFSTLNDLGIGPPEGFRIDDDTLEWSSFLNGDNRLNDVKTYVYLRVRKIFDPPGTSFLLEAVGTEIKELEWRINARREVEQWTDPVR